MTIFIKTFFMTHFSPAKPIRNIFKFLRKGQLGNYYVLVVFGILFTAIQTGSGAFKLPA
jgi:hypothetical protein